EERPSYVAAWIKRARSTSYEPDLLSDKPAAVDDADHACAAFDKFRDNMASWWRALNPEWRHGSTGTFALDRGQGDWSQLYYTGKNGLVSLVVCLKWWWEMLDYEEVEEEDGDREEWHNAVKDVSWAFQQVLRQYQ
ncbi:hypothetical protein HDZ31DRAFT_49794, partial [Schizophyllum fasciatum]